MLVEILSRDTTENFRSTAGVLADTWAGGWGGGVVEAGGVSSSHKPLSSSHQMRGAVAGPEGLVGGWLGGMCRTAGPSRRPPLPRVARTWGQPGRVWLAPGLAAGGESEESSLGFLLMRLREGRL